MLKIVLLEDLRLSAAAFCAVSQAKSWKTTASYDTHYIN